MIKPTLLALMPCGLRNSFKAALYERFPQYVNDLGESEKLIIDGNLNYEKSFYEDINRIKSIEHLPDILITADINSFYHQDFLKNFLNKENFEVFKSDINPSYEKAGYYHPEGLFAMLPANLLVIVADISKVAESEMPQNWTDLLKPEWERKIALRGDKDFFCNAVFFPYLKRYGFDALKALAKNTAIGLHPSQMVKMMNNDHTDDISIYVMPYTFYRNVKNKDRFIMIWPFEGGIVSPVQMLVKKGKYEEHQEIIDFILSHEMRDRMLQLGYPGDVQTEIRLLNWIGWDYIYSHDIQHEKEEMQRIFFESFNGEKK